MSAARPLTRRREGGALVIATIVESDRPAIERAIAAAGGAGADAIEVRFDAAPGTDPAGLGESAALPLLATCRPRREGGLFDGSEEERVRILERAGRSGRFLLDVELGSDAARLVEANPAWAGVLSRHDPPAAGGPGLPARLKGLAEDLLACAGPFPIVKVIGTAARAADLVAARHLLAERRDPRLACFLMGEAGVASRVLAGAWGSAAVWAAARRGAPGAPGQLALEALLRVYRFRQVGERTRIYAVAGSPVGGSLSPALHNGLFERLGLDAVYVPIECADAAELALLVRTLPLAGVSVTAPLKVPMLEQLEALDGEARQAGAVNTLVGLRGHNTDGPAALEEIRSRVEPAGRAALIAGAGGAAAAVGFALARAGARLTITNRGEARGQALARRLGARFVPIEDLVADAEAIVVQATSAPREDPVLPRRALAAALVLDLRYGPGETATVAEARRLGSAAADGLGMLVRQAAGQARLFTGREPPGDWPGEALDRSRELLW